MPDLDLEPPWNSAMDRTSCNTTLTACRRLNVPFRNIPLQPMATTAVESALPDGGDLPTRACHQYGCICDGGPPFGSPMCHPFPGAYVQRPPPSPSNENSGRAPPGTVQLAHFWIRLGKSTCRSFPERVLGARGGIKKDGEILQALLTLGASIWETAA